MKEALISYEVAKLAKEKGYDNESSYYYPELIKEIKYDSYFPSLQPTKSDKYYDAPSQSLLQKWLREKHNIHVWCIPNNQPTTCDGYVGFYNAISITGEKTIHMNKY